MVSKISRVFVYMFFPKLNNKAVDAMGPPWQINCHISQHNAQGYKKKQKLHDIEMYNISLVQHL